MVRLWMERLCGYWFWSARTIVRHGTRRRCEFQRMSWRQFRRQITEPAEYQHHPPCIVAAELAGRHCDDAGWRDRPDWVTLAAGGRPPNPLLLPHEMGTWEHGWQFQASSNLERRAFRGLLQTLGGRPNARRNAATAEKRGYDRAWVHMRRHG